MNESDRTERVRIILGRRIVALREEFELPALSRVRKIKLVAALLKVRGDLPTDPDLRVLYRMALRGMFD